MYGPDGASIFIYTEDEDWDRHIVCQVDWGDEYAAYLHF